MALCHRMTATPQLGGSGALDRLVFKLKNDLSSPEATITSMPEAEITANNNYHYQIETEGLEGELQYEVQGPAGVTVDSTGLLHWLPTNADVGTADIQVSVIAAAQTLTQEFVLTILPDVVPNQPPVFTSIPASEITLGETYSYTPTATDPDNDVVTFTLTNAVTGVILENDVVTWTPDESALGEGVRFTLVADDGKGGQAQQQVSILVKSPPNQAPVITSTPPDVLLLGDVFEYQIIATDAEQQGALTYSILNAPDGATFNAETGFIRWSGYPVTLASITFEVVVTDPEGLNTNQLIDTLIQVPPLDCLYGVTEAQAELAGCGRLYFNTKPETTLIQGETHQYQPGVSLDDSFEFSLVVAPTGAQINFSTGLVTWQTSTLTAGTYFFVLQADAINSGTYALQSYALTVSAPPNQVPMIESVQDIVLFTDQPIDQQLNFIGQDADNDPLSWNLNGLPDGLNFAADTLRLTGNMAAIQAGEYPVQVMLSDGKTSAVPETFIISVLPNQNTYEYWAVYRDLGLTTSYNTSPQLTLFSEEETVVTLEIEALNIIDTLVVPANTLKKVTLPRRTTVPSGTSSTNTVLPAFSVHLTSQKDISVLSGNYVVYSNDSTHILEKNSLGTQYITNTGTQQQQVIESAPTSTSVYQAYVYIVATENDTNVSITPAISGQFEQQDIIKFSLSKGQVYVVRPAFFTMIGAKVQSNKPIAVFNIGDCVSIWGGACDSVYEQYVPNRLLDTYHLVTPTRYKSSGDIISIASTVDGNEVSYGDQTVVLNTGESKALYIAAPTEIRSTSPVSVHQWITGRTNLDITGIEQVQSQFRDLNITGNEPSFVQVPGRQFWQKNYQVSTLGHPIAFNIIKMIVPTTALTSLTVNNAPPPAYMITSAIEGTDYTWVTLEVKPGIYTLNSNESFLVMQYGLGHFETYFHSSVDYIENDTHVVDSTPIDITAQIGKPLCQSITLHNSNNQLAVDRPVHYFTIETGMAGMLFTDAAGQVEHCLNSEQEQQFTTLYFGSSKSKYQRLIRQWSGHEVDSAIAPTLYSNDSFKVLGGDTFAYQLNAYSTDPNETFTFSIPVTTQNNQASVSSNGLIRIENMSNGDNSNRSALNHTLLQPFSVQVTGSNGGQNFKTITPRLVEVQEPGRLLQFYYDYPRAITSGDFGQVQLNANTDLQSIEWLISPSQSDSGFQFISSKDNYTIFNIKTTGAIGPQIQRVVSNIIDTRSDLEYVDYFEITATDNLEPNENPAISDFDLPQIYAGETSIISVDAKDPDGDTLYFSSLFSQAFLGYRAKFYNPTMDEVEFTRTSLQNHLYFDFEPGVAGSTTFTISAFDGRRNAYSGQVGRDNLTLPIYVTVRSNALPTIISAPSTQVLSNQVFSYQLLAEDTDQAVDLPLTYRLEQAPNGMTLSDSGVLQWLPSNTHIGIHPIKIRVVDEQFGFALQTFFLSVLQAPNSPPVFDAVADQEIQVGETLTLSILANDPENNAISYQFIKSPSGMSLLNTGGQALISWTPNSNKVGVHQVQVQAIDSDNATSNIVFNVTVIPQPTGEPPNFTSLPPSLIIQPGDVFRYEVSAEDPDGDTLTYSLGIAPFEMVLLTTDQQQQKQIVQWATTTKTQGFYAVQVRVSDGQYTQVQDLMLEVVDRINNTEPRILSTPNTVALLGFIYQYDVQAVDIDNDTLTYELMQAPVGMSINELTGSVSWQPSDSDLGQHDIVIRVTDAKGAFTQQDYILSVASDAVIQIISMPPTTAIVGEEYFYVVRLVHGASNGESFTLLTAPSGMNIDAQGVIRWTPEETVAAVVDVEVQVTGPNGQVDSQSFQISTSLGRILNRRVCRINNGGQ